MIRIATACVALVAAMAGCHSNDPSSPDAETEAGKSPQQELIDSSASAFRRMDRNPEFDAMDNYRRTARAVAVFPKVVKAGFIVGGSGGKGVLSARTANGELSAPVFYTLGGGSVGLQIGYDEATVVMFLMTDKGAALRPERRNQGRRQHFRHGRQQGRRPAGLHCFGHRLFRRRLRTLRRCRAGRSGA